MRIDSSASCSTRHVSHKLIVDSGKMVKQIHLLQFLIRA